MKPRIRVGDYLRLSAQRYPDVACFVFADGTEQSFAETNIRVNRLADAMTNRGVSKGDKVAIVATDCSGYVEVLLACMKLGAVYVPLNNRLAEAELLTLLRRARPTMLFVTERYLDVARNLSSQVEGLHHLIDFDQSIGEEAYEALVASGEDIEPDVDVRDDDVIGLAFTSGTTGLPKGVLQSQKMLKSLIVNMSIDYEIQPDEFRYTASPTFHIAGQAMILMHIWRGFPTLILPQFDPREVLRWMQSGRLTGVFLVPTMISTLLDLPEAAVGSYPALKSIIYGASPISPTLLRKAIETFDCNLVNAFGAATEGGLQTVMGSADHKRAVAGETHLLGSIGKPAFGVELRIVDESGKDVPRGQTGEIITRSDAVMNGYLEMPEETTRAIQDGWFWGGDLAYQDEDGFLYLAGRSKDMIIRGGENIYPIEIETVISEFPGVAQVAVVGEPDDHWGEIVVAYVTSERDIDLDDLQRVCRERLAAYKVPAKFVVVPEMPLNASGKILKRELRTNPPEARTTLAGSRS